MRRLILVLGAAAAVAMCAACKDPPSAPATTTATATATATTTTVAMASASTPTTPTPAGAMALKTDTIATSAGDLGITPVHHATVLLDFGGKHIYLDPSKEAPKLDAMPKADFVFITDIHPDHLDKEALAMVRGPATQLVGPPAVNDQQKVDVVMKNGDTHAFGQGSGAFSVEAVPMYNLVRGPSAGKLYHDKGRGDGYVFTFGDKRVYVSGDTECTPEMKALTRIDVAFVCMNLPYTMPPTEAAECVNAFRPKVVFPYHYRGSNLEEFSSALDPAAKIDVRARSWY